MANCILQQDEYHLASCMAKVDNVSRAKPVFIQIPLDFTLFLVEFVQKLATPNTGHPGHGCRQETRDQGPIWAVALLRGLSSDDLPWIQNVPEVYRPDSHTFKYFNTALGRHMGLKG